MVAAELARTKEIRVYTIGVGSNGLVKTQVNSPFGSYATTMETEIDEELLKRIAKVTNGKYFRAKDEKSLKRIYEEIETLEKKKIEDQQYKSDPPPTPQSFLNVAILITSIIWCIQFILFHSNE
jgi:Ca-activated chloride channel family protein